MVQVHFKTEDNPLVTKEFLEEAREEIGESRFRREYLAEFVEDEKTYFPMALIRSAVHICSTGNHCSYCDVISGSSAPLGDLYAGTTPGGLCESCCTCCGSRAALYDVENAFKKRIIFRVVVSKSS